MKQMMEEMQSLKQQTSMMGQQLGGLNKNFKKVNEAPVMRKSAEDQRNPNRELFEDSEQDDN
jgi:hypothetical protein